MDIDYNLQPIGPERLRERFAQLRASLGQSSPDLGIDKASGAFSLDKAGLTGAIGGGSDDGNQPFLVGGPGVSIQSDKASPQMRAMIEKAANENGVDPYLLDAVVSTESSYDPNCRSRAGAMGLTQLMPETARSMGVTNPFDPAQSLDGGAKYLSQMLAKFGKLENAVAAYNAGPGAVLKHGGIPPYIETQNYVRKVVGLYNLKKGS